METPAPPWPKCGSCKDGRIALFTSVAQCAQCIGTGFDLSDERLQTPLQSQQIMVRTRKILERRGVETLGQLLCFAMLGQLSHEGLLHGTTIADAEELLRRCGLPTGPRPANR
jgi:hypothetical protein